MLVYIDDREDEELNDSYDDKDYGYDYGRQDAYDYEYDSEKHLYDYIESDDNSYFD